MLTRQVPAFFHEVRLVGRGVELCMHVVWPREGLAMVKREMAVRSRYSDAVDVMPKEDESVRA